MLRKPQVCAGETSRRQHVPRFLPLLSLCFLAACSADALGPDDSGIPGASSAATVLVTPGDALLAVGQTTTLAAEVRDSSEAVLPGASVTWSSSAPGVATVSANGRVTARAEGDVVITATSGSADGDASVRVRIVEVCECAVVIDSANLGLVSRDSLTGRFEFLLLDGEMPEIDTTKVIVGAQALGFLRHVSGVERDGDRLVLETSQAGLADVIVNGGFGGSTQIFAQGTVEEETGSAGSRSIVWGPEEVVYLAPGVTRTGPTSLDLSGLKLSGSAEQGGESTLPVDFEFAVDDGALNFGPTLDMGAQIGAGGLQEFHAIYTGGLSLSANSDANEPLAWSFTVSKSLEAEASRPLLTLRKSFVFWAGYVPVAGQLVFTITAKATASATAAGSYAGGFGAGFDVTGGMRYDGSWRPVMGANTNWQGTPPAWENLSGEVELKGSLTVQPELYLSLYYVGGPFVQVQPTLEAPAAVGFPGLDWYVRADYITKLALGARAEILRKQPKGKFKGWTGDDLLKLEASFSIPMHKPIILLEAYSRGPLVVTDSTYGDDLDANYDVELTPAFTVNDAWIGFDHAESTQTIQGKPANDRRVLESIRSGEDYPHRVRLTDVAGNCTVQRTVFDTVAIRSNLRIATPGFADGDTARAHFPVECIPLGAVKVVSVTTGPDPDPDGYAVALTRIDTVGTSAKWFDDADDGAGPGAGGGAGGGGPVVAAAATDSAEGPPIGIAGEVLIDSLIPKNPDPRSRATGEHRFGLEGVRENCAVARPVSHEATVLSGDTLITGFEVRCIELGDVRIRTNTLDPDPPPPSDPILLAARIVRIGTPEDSVRVALGSTDEVVVEDRIPLYTASGASGQHLVEAVTTALPDRCRLATAASRTVTVLSGETAEVAFDAACVERLHVRTRTTGAGSDPDGYEVSIESAASSKVLRATLGGNDAVGVPGTFPGASTIRLAGVSSNCVAATSSVNVVIDGRDSTLVTFDVDCPTGHELVRDSVDYSIADASVAIAPGRLQATLGDFVVPDPAPGTAIEVWVDVERSSDQPDETFAVGTQDGGGPAFAVDGGCPAVPDDGSSGRRWVRVGWLPPTDPGSRTFIARHGTEFGCYVPASDLGAANSVHFYGIRLAYWRVR